MVALFVAATIVTLMQLFHTRERRLIPLAMLFVFLALGLSREHWDAWQNRFFVGALGAGLALLVGLSHPRFGPGGARGQAPASRNRGEPTEGKDD